MNLVDLHVQLHDVAPHLRRECSDSSFYSSLAGPLRISNFPIHFFDALLSTRPTFGIALARWEQERHGDERVDLPDRGLQSTSFPANEISSIGEFLSSILSTANWQDSMQSLLSGYAERIVTVLLDESREGGMNLSMDAETIATFARFGRLAGEKLTREFVFDQHRLDRAISLLPQLEGSLAQLAAAYESRPAGAPDDALTYADVLTELDTAHYKTNSKFWRRDPFAKMAADLAKIGKHAADLEADDKRKSIGQGYTPRTDSQIRLVATADRVPRGAGPEIA